MARSGWVRQTIGAAVLVASVAESETAEAQPLGVFRWQTHPFCNVLTLAVTATPSGFRMEGTDDQCGGTPASAIGMAYPKADGTVGMGLTLIFASAVSLHVDGTIVPGAGFSGSWSDSVGRAGTLFLTPGAAVGGSVRPVVAPVVTYGSTVVQPPGGTDRGLSATVATDTGTANDAAGLYGRFGAPIALQSPAPAGVHGDSAARVGVMGLTDTGHGVVGGAGTGVGVQGYASSGANSIAMQAVHLDGGTALEIRNGTIKVSGDVRTAFIVTLPSAGCHLVDHPLLNGDPNALVFVTAKRESYYSAANWASFYDRWGICAIGASTGPTPVMVLVVKQ
jgi:hypothetical protein